MLTSLAGLAVVLAVAAGIVGLLADRKLHRIVQLPPLQMNFAMADGQLEHGEYLSLAQVSDAELDALFVFLKALDAHPSGQR